MRKCPVCKVAVEGRPNKIFCTIGCKAKSKDKPWLKHRKEECEECGFVPKHICQLDVDHMDGEKKNNEASNLKTLCANCHRYKTFLSGDWMPKQYRVSTVL